MQFFIFEFIEDVLLSPLQTNTMTLQEKLFSKGPKRILSLDGGGIRGALTLGYLKKIEEMLRLRYNKPDMVLSDYFDLIGGTSTGAIIATTLSLGYDVDFIVKKYFELGGEIFSGKHSWLDIGDRLGATYDAKPLEKQLKSIFGDITLGNQEQVKTGLCVVTKRADTNSIWPVFNHPNGKYYNSQFGNNAGIYLRDIVRASAAAPTYFIPIRIDAGGGFSGAFVDGGVSMANNPALQLFMIATMKNHYPFGWEKGENNLLIVSVGTGFGRFDTLPDRITKNKLWDWAQQIPDMLMSDASWHNQCMLQWMSRSPTAQQIDGELQDLAGDMLVPEPLLSYLRYNICLEEASLKNLELYDLDSNGNRIKAGKEDRKKVYVASDIPDLLEMSNAKSRFMLYQIGYTTAQQQVDPRHFSGAFDLMSKA